MHPYFHHLFDRLQGRGDEDAVATRWAFTALGGGLAWVYGLGAWGRRGLYSRGVLKVKRLPAPVVSVGNLAVGGTGKTPVTAALARLFQAHGKKVAILSRGYGGQNRGVTCLSDGDRIYHQPPQVGEEAYWLARSLPGVAVYTGPCRHAAGLAAWEQFQPDLFLLDDGFQHFQLHRDLDLVLLDAAVPFGNGQVLPRGTLREPRSALNTAQVLVLTRYQGDRDRRTLTDLQKAFPRQTVLTAAIEPTTARVFPDGREEAPTALKGRTLLAFAGLARPEFFERTLEELGVALASFQTLPDHHYWDQTKLAYLVRLARVTGAEALVTTAKDWARLGEQWDADLPLWVLEVEARVSEPEAIWGLYNRLTMR
jgi:tetraacyldisaccharide 4'-kinase